VAESEKNALGEPLNYEVFILFYKC